MKNFEYLSSLSAEELERRTLAIDNCKQCAYRGKSKCDNGVCIDTCVDGMTEWLEQEYVELADSKED